ncbi:MAG: transporter substrate-binding domain-containing protein [Rhodoferax sp.]|uniref:transporter substrate-binding domain-containing protein n=1 Tax=Rhodoferax sp. TaxID=50421 RepID=UPI003017ACF6
MTFKAEQPNIWVKRLTLVLAASVISLGAVAGDLNEIKASGVLRHLGIKYANFVKADGTGFDVELAQGFAKYLGVRYELVYTNFYDVIRDLLGKDVARTGDTVNLEGNYPIRGDMIATGFTVLPWRQQVVLYSQPTFPSQVLLVARTSSPYQPVAAEHELRNEIASTRAVLGKKSLLVMERTCLDPANYGLKGKGIDLRSYTANTNLDEMVPELLKGDVEFTLLDVPDAVIDLQRWAGRIKVIGPISEHQDLAAAFPKSSPVLRAAFDDYLSGIRADGSYDKLVNRYYPGIRRYFPNFFARSQ